jgi:SAM-dependent methyltransferase
MSEQQADGAGSETEPAVNKWTETNSAHFIDLGKIYTPRRDELASAFADLIPADDAELFTGVELGSGQGWLIEMILRRYPQARMIGLDGSETMLHAAAETTASFKNRVEFRLFRLEASDWLDQIPDGLRCVVSSLVIHHLKGPEKAALFQALYAKLAPGGALLINDVVEPTSDWSRRHLARAWNEDVARQSLEFAGNDRAYRHFIDAEWNLYEFPLADDDIDYPSTLPKQLAWLEAAGFTGVDAFWARAGHVLFGGYKPS